MQRFLTEVNKPTWCTIWHKHVVTSRQYVAARAPLLHGMIAASQWMEHSEIPSFLGMPNPLRVAVCVHQWLGFTHEMVDDIYLADSCVRWPAVFDLKKMGAG